MLLSSNIPQTLLQKAHKKITNLKSEAIKTLTTNHMIFASKSHYECKLEKYNYFVLFWWMAAWMVWFNQVLHTQRWNICFPKICTIQLFIFLTIFFLESHFLNAMYWCTPIQMCYFMIYIHTRLHEWSINIEKPVAMLSIR